MADFLESFDFGSDGPRKPRDTRCASVSELADNLRGAVAAKTTPSRAEHVTVTYELRNTARFALTPADQGYDEAVGPTAAAPNPETEPQGGEKTTVTANQVILNQTDDPTRQRAVAVHIVRALGAADGCAWVVRESSRARHGWSFRYACAASHSEWIRRSAKDPPKTTIGDWSLRVPDQALMDRPAFDCRGSITIGFNRSSHSVTVSYAHTLLHETVGQLRERFPVQPREPGPGYQRQLEARNAPKPPKTKTPKKPRSDRPPGEKKERKRKADGEKSDRPRKRKRDKKAAAAAAGEGSSSGQQGQPAASASGTVPLVSVSPEEAARRLATARELLSSAGVDPDTLSTEQMNIFANQAPSIQKDSVAMLAKYGAQQLQIVHPQNKARQGPQQAGQPAQGQQDGGGAASSAGQTADSSTGPVTTKELALGDGDGAPAQAKSKRKMGKSRLSCYQCKSRKARCPKGRPSCSECLSTGQTCEYPSQNPRVRKSKGATAEGAADADAAADGQDQEADTAAEDTVVADPDEVQQLAQLAAHQADQQPALVYPAEPLDTHEEEEEDDDKDEPFDSYQPQATLPPPPPAQPQPTPHFQSASGLALPLANLIHNQRASISPQLDDAQAAANQQPPPDLPPAHDVQPAPAPFSNPWMETNAPSVDSQRHDPFSSQRQPARDVSILQQHQQHHQQHQHQQQRQQPQPQPPHRSSASSSTSQSPRYPGQPRNAGAALPRSRMSPFQNTSRASLPTQPPPQQQDRHHQAQQQQQHASRHSLGTSRSSASPANATGLRYPSGGNSSSGGSSARRMPAAPPASDITYRPYSHQQAMTQPQAQRSTTATTGLFDSSHAYAPSRADSSSTLSDPMAAVAEAAANRLPQNTWASGNNNNNNNSPSLQAQQQRSRNAAAPRHSYAGAGTPQQTQAPYYDPFNAPGPTGHAFDMFGGEARQQKGNEQGGWNFFTQSGRGFL